ncbi:MAG: hypothetical protein U9N82_03545 [Thermodesulfobacteriota bacterium]|nr:hypothetical protein [Thermodesulfobacteriota bacterium]
MKARIVAILLFVGFTFLFPCCDGSDSTYLERTSWEGLDPKTIDTANWMGELPLYGFLRLNQIILPGSHDSGMYEFRNCNIPSVIVNRLVKTQNLNFFEQLVSGSRYFDIRVDVMGHDLVTYHRTSGLGCAGAKIKDILDQTVSFLTFHPSEFVILKFSHFDHEGCKDVLNQELDNYDKFLFKQWDEQPNLIKEPLYRLRGHFVALLQDFGHRINPIKGRWRYADFFHVDRYLPGSLTVYDQYSETPDYEKMKKDQLIKLGGSGGLGKDFLHLFSWTLTPVIFAPPKKKHWENLQWLAKEANSKLPGVLYDIYRTCFPYPNVVYIDYVNILTNQHIIKYNFDYDPCGRLPWPT